MKADGRVDPLHVPFQLKDDQDRTIVSAHTYPDGLGGKSVWFSRASLIYGRESKYYFLPAPKKKDADKEDKEKDKENNIKSISE